MINGVVVDNPPGATIIQQQNANPSANTNGGLCQYQSSFEVAASAAFQNYLNAYQQSMASLYQQQQQSQQNQNQALDASVKSALKADLLDRQLMPPPAIYVGAGGQTVMAPSEPSLDLSATGAMVEQLNGDSQMPYVYVEDPNNGVLYMKPSYGHCEHLRQQLKQLMEQQKTDKVEDKQSRKLMDGVGAVLKQLKEPRARIALDESGAVINGGMDADSSRLSASTSTSGFGSMAPTPTPSVGGGSSWSISSGYESGNSGSNMVLHPTPMTIPGLGTPGALLIRTTAPDEIAGAIAHPTKPSEIRKLIRSKMIRCRKCKNRFTEKHIYERHLRDKHPAEHLAYLIQIEEEMLQQRREELEANRLDELVSGGFIPPAEDVDATNFELVPEEIPLPGELTNGIPARFNRFGMIIQPPRVYKKKVSPQCPFCDKRYKNEYSLKKHILKKHPECQEFTQCLKCFRPCISPADLQSHLCEMRYICFECNPIRNLCTEERLYTHRLKFHRGENSGFKCNLCPMKFLTPRKLRKHKKMMHVFTKTFACHFCDELFISETAVTTHERVHTGMIRFECRICDYKCNRFTVMEKHREEEHGFLCSICQQKLIEWSDLKNHTLIEHGGYLSSEFTSGYIECPRVWVMFKGE